MTLPTLLYPSPEVEQEDTTAKIIKAVMGSASEDEFDGLYIMNALELSPMRTTLEELDYPQLATPLRTD